MRERPDTANLKAGDTLPGFRTDPITPVTLALFAGGSGDHNPIHLDAEFARANGFDEVFAHGMLSMAFLGRLLSDWVPADQILSYGVRFAAITPLRAEVECRGVVKEVREQGGRRVAELELSTLLPDGTVTLTGDAVVALDRAA
jgi:acyl dehydratase